MKKLVAVLALFLSVQFLHAAPGKNPKEELTEAQKVRLTEIENRIEVIFITGKPEVSRGPIFRAARGAPLSSR